MMDYLRSHRIKHIFGTPYHPQGRGKIERFNRRIKEKLCLVVYCSPQELKGFLEARISANNQTPHEALDNVSSKEVYADRKMAILHKRPEKMNLTKSNLQSSIT